MQKLRRLHDAELDRHLAAAYDSLDRLRTVPRTGGVSTGLDSGGVEDLFLTITLLDLIICEFLKNKLGRCHDEVFTIHEHLGRLDAAISIASYRASLPAWIEPELSFEGAGSVRAVGLVHPLLEHAVPNDLVTGRPLLITGSNASGKSTYLKTAALAAVMAQSICTVLAETYEARAFRVYSSMALRDDLLAGESYYIVETRSLKRILDAAKTGQAILCVVDEVLRGTNTVERIAASSQVLQALADAGVLCLAATHDIELCALLDGVYRLFHFEEQVGEEEMLFDYRLRPGKATSRNAINLLRLMGFDQALVDKAHEAANRYLETGSWQKS
jgi:DNA mismatch repair ATPase MutS